MSHPSKQKGTGYEREVTEKLAASGIESERTWGSDGRSRGLGKEVDVIVRDSIYLQLKRPQSVPQYLYPSDKSHMKLVTDEGASETYAVIWLRPHYLSLLHFEPIAPTAEEESRHTVGNDWIPSGDVVGQVFRADYETDKDLVMMHKDTLGRMIRAVQDYRQPDE